MTTPPKPIRPECACDQKCRDLEEQDRWLALLIRQGLKVIVTGIEKRYGLEHETQRDRRAS